jgi:NifU-like protein involved in Fe-S cluster formation
MSYAAHIPLIGTIDRAMGEGTAHSRLCGSRIEVTLDLADGRVSRFAQQVKACIVGQAAAAMLAEQILGLTRAEIAEGREQVRRMVGEGMLPAGRWAAFALLEPVRAYPSRHATVLLPFDAALRAIDAAVASPVAGDQDRAGKAPANG